VKVIGSFPRKLLSRNASVEIIEVVGFRRPNCANLTPVCADLSGICADLTLVCANLILTCADLTWS
jgi:hypothetical protein